MEGGGSQLPRRVSALECQMCVRPPTDPVVSTCGHVFCWPCIHPWLQDDPSRKPCPQCGTLLNRDMSILRLYANNAADGADEPPDVDVVIPPRPPNPLTFFPDDFGSSPAGASGVDKVLQRILLSTNKEKHDLHMLVQAKATMEQIARDLQHRNSVTRQENSRIMESIVGLQSRLAQGHRPLPTDTHEHSDN